MSLRRLTLECIELFQLHRIDPKVALEDQVGVLVDLQTEGKIRHIGLSNVSLQEILAAQRMATIATVHNRYNPLDREPEQVLNFCSDAGLDFIPWSPMAAGALSNSRSRLAAVALQLQVTPNQVALAWLLRRSPLQAPCPWYILRKTCPPPRYT